MHGMLDEIGLTPNAGFITIGPTFLVPANGQVTMAFPQPFVSTAPTGDSVDLVIEPLGGAKPSVVSDTVIGYRL